MNNDLFGKALLDYQNGNATENIKTFSSVSGEDVFLLPYLFRNFDEMPVVERKALELASGKILDIGCGAGSHSLYLQKTTKNITAIDTSAGAIKTCKLRGVNEVFQQDIWNITDKHFDTLLLLMNGIGICGKLQFLPKFLNHLKYLLTKKGQIILDSTDLIYLYQDKTGDVFIDDDIDYYGEVTYTMSYNNTTAEPFNWLFVDFNTLNHFATNQGLKCELIFQGYHYDYLAKLTFN